MAKKKTIEELQMDYEKQSLRAQRTKELLEKEIQLEEKRKDERIVKTIVMYYKLQGKSTDKNDILHFLEEACKKVKTEQSAMNQGREKNSPTKMDDENDTDADKDA